MLIGLFLFPFVASGLLSLFPLNPIQCLKRLAIVLSLGPLALLLYGHLFWLEARLDYAWLPSIAFTLQVDALSLVFLYLTALVIPISLFSVEEDRLAAPRLFYVLILLLQGLLIGFFTAHNLFVFT